MKELCGVKRYDSDFQDIVFDQRGKRRPVASLLRKLSYSKSFLAAASAAAKEKGITDALYITAQYRFVYDPRKVKKAAPDPVFLGCFTWNDQEDAVFMKTCLEAIRKAEIEKSGKSLASKKPRRRKS